MGEKLTAKYRITFTQNRLESIDAKGRDRLYYYDTKRPGLCVCVTAAGGKTFYWLGKIDGRTVRLMLGKFPAITVDAARSLAVNASSSVAKGIDPHAARQAARHEHTVQGLWEHWQEHCEGRKKPRSIKEDKRQYNALLKPWAGRKLSSIHKSDVQALHTRVGKENGHYSANRLLALVRAMFNKAGDIGFTGDNPAKGIQKFREEKRDRFLEGDELPKFFQAVAAETNVMLRDFFLLALLTGARKSNVLSMQWQDIDLAAGRWRIPDTKAGVPVVVPLVPAAVAILEARHKANGSSPWVFPSHGATGHIVEPKSAWRRICDRAGLADVRIHDLRRSLGSWQAMGGSSLPIIGRSLGHTQPTTTAIYARLQMDPVRTSVEAATTAMLAAGKASIDGGNVVIDVHSTDEIPAV